ncbi:MAG: mechanosensitive ion channel domain-containing protein [Phycisphaerales bacterium]
MIRRFLCGFILIGAFVGFPAPGHQDQPGQASQAGAAPSITMADLDALKNAADAIEDPERKQQVEETYATAKSLIEQARSVEAEAARFEKERAEAPALLETIRQELAQPATERSASLPENPTVDQVQQAVTQAQAELTTAQQQVRDLEAEQTRRTTRRDAIPGELAQARQQLTDLAEQPEAAAEGEPVEITNLRRAERQAQRRLYEAQIRRLERELASYDARRELLPARRDRAVRRVNELQRLVDGLQTTLNETRRQEAERSAEQAQEALRAAAGASEAIRTLAEENAEFAALRTGDTGVPTRLSEARRQRDNARAALDSLARNYVRVRDLIGDIGLTNTVGITLRAFRNDLPNVDRLDRRIGARQAVVQSAIYQLYDLEQQRRDLADLESEVTAAVAEYREQTPGASNAEIEAVTTEARQILQNRVALLDDAIRDYRAYRELLLELDAYERRLRDATKAFDAFIAERVLWIASARPIDAGDFTEALDRLQWSFDPDAVSTGAGAIWTDWRQRPVRPLFALALVAIILYVRRQIGINFRRSATREVGPLRGALEGAALAVLMAAAWPAFALLGAWMLRGGALVSGAPTVRMGTLAQSLEGAAILLFLLRFVQIVCRPGGYAVTRLNWRETVATSIRTRLRWYTPVAVLLAVVALTAPLDVGDTGVNAPDPTSLRRLASTSFMFATSLALWGIFRPRGPVMAHIRLSSRGGWHARLRFLWLAIIVGGPVVIAGLSLAGYVYTGVELGRRLLGSLWVLAGIIILQSALMQWLVSARRKLELEQARRRREAAELEEEEDTPGGEGSVRPAEETDLAALDTQTRRLFRSGFAITAVVFLWLIWADAAPALRMLERVELYPRFGEVASVEEVRDNAADSILDLSGYQDRTPAQQPAESTTAPTQAGGAQTTQGGSGATSSIPGPTGAMLSSGSSGDASSADASVVNRLTLGQVLLAALVGIVAIAGSRNLPGLIEITLLQRLDLDSGLRNAITALVRYTIAIVGVFMVFSLVGFGWSKVQWLAAALTFGLAFGLQEIFANFVSGLIILLERPIRIGDTVTVGDVSGEVSQIRFRATTITDWDRKELVVPNKEFITTRLVNWTLTDPVTRIKIPVGIAYGSDVQKATDIMLRVARGYANILNEPAPQALFLGFGDNSLNFEMRVHIPHMRHLIEVRDAMHRQIDAEFRKAGIEISFPQRDLHLRSVSDGAAKAIVAGLRPKRTEADDAGDAEARPTE